MSYRVKRKPPQSPTKKAIQDAINMQAPLGAPQPEYQRKRPVRRDWDESVADVGEKKE